MTNLETLRSQLNACKGSGRWGDIADKAGCHYFTVARIARGAIKSPGIDLAERISAAIKTTEPRRARAAA